MSIDRTLRRAIHHGLAVLAAFLVVSASGLAFAKDSIAVNVANATGSPVVVNNGQAVGTIQLFYTVNATQFTPGTFATFDLNWATVLGGSPQPTNYSAGITFTVDQAQQGGNVDLDASPASFLLTGAGQSGTSTITVSITADKNGNLPSNVDGTDLVGNLKLDAGRAIGTVTNIQVHIRLAHPTNCIKVYNFVTDQDFNVGVLSTTNLNVPSNGRNAGKVVSSQPGQFSDNVLVANVCGASHSFDLRVTLDSNFSTNPENNPGNAVFAYNGVGEFDPTTFGSLLAGNGTGYQQNLCLQNMTVEPGQSLLVTVHSKLKDGLLQTSLPADKVFRFQTTLYQAVNASCSGVLDSLASPNPATFALPFTTN